MIQGSRGAFTDGTEPESVPDVKNRSPIERMVDRACGVPDDYEPPPRVLLECPGCRKTKNIALDQTDPPGTARVLTQCPECVKGDFSSVEYFNAKGQQIDLDGKPILP
jgi:hypothetical protein